jgi:hypothetical protein
MTCQVGVAVVVLQQADVGVELPLRDQHRAEALDRHVGERKGLLKTMPKCAPSSRL